MIFRIQSCGEWKQILAILIAGLSAFCTSTLFGWTSPSIPILITSNKYAGIDIEAASYLTVISSMATLVTCPLWAIYMEKFGRKPTLLICAVLQCASWMFIIWARSIYVFYASRVTFGAADAAMFVALPAYIAEVSTPKVRGTWGNALTLYLFLGFFAINVVGFYFDITNTAYIFITIPVMFFAIFLFMPETPTYFIIEGKMEEAKRSLLKLRRSKNVDDEFNQLTADVTRQKSEPQSYKDVLLIDSNRKAITILILARGLQHFSGISFFIIYTQYIFKESVDDINAGHSSMIFSGAFFIANCFTTFFVDRLGRKTSMVVSCIGSTIVLAAEAIYFYLREHDLMDLSRISWFPVVGMFLYAITASIGLSLVPILLLGELVSASVKGKVSCIATISYCIYISSSTKLYQYLLTNYGLSTSLICCTVVAAIGIVFSYFCIPETKGKTLEEIQQMLKGNSLSY